MKPIILGFMAAGLLAGSLGAQAVPVVDQSNVDEDNASFSGFGPWQQEVIVGVSGLLSGLEITFESLEPSAGTLDLWIGSPWQATAPRFSASYADAFGATYFDVSAEGIYLSSGDRFTFGLIGTWGAIRGSYGEGPSGIYPGDLYSDEPDGGCYVDCGWDLGFRTFMTPVPEPGTLALLGLGLAGLGLSLRRKTV